MYTIVYDEISTYVRAHGYHIHCGDVHQGTLNKKNLKGEPENGSENGLYPQKHG